MNHRKIIFVIALLIFFSFLFIFNLQQTQAQIEPIIFDEIQIQINLIQLKILQLQREIANLYMKEGKMEAWYANNYDKGYDKSNFGRGWSEPESAAKNCGWPPGSKGYIKDCGCCYIHSHIHDLGAVFKDKQILIEYMPGLHKECSTLMTVSYSNDGKNWNMVLEITVIQETWPKTVYNKKINVLGEFRYIKIFIPKCYNDYSSAKVLGDIY